MHESNIETASAATWGGGTRPFSMGSKKLGMWLFIVSDSLTFASMLLAYSYERLCNPDWPRPFEFNPAILKGSGLTAILLASSLTMVMAVAAAARNNRKAAVRWILATMLGGILFVLLHLTEWFKLLGEGVTPWSNPWNVPLFGATFFGVTGLHMLHVSIGVMYLGIIATGFGTGHWTAEDVEVSGLYWHFVDLVWMFVFPMIYLMSVKI
ncbi:MAG TPA: cytochrome c oxidase subunit 3 [Methylomirabilota bacterium]|nr:cytochrome c oxidase subunit 3 [Methylomirabilota bacterium]